MPESQFLWKKQTLRTHVDVIKGNVSPTKILKNATYLHGTLKRWLKGHIWIYEDRIVYIGAELPNDLSDVSVYDCTGQYVVPGYIEPHVHPFQLYNPLTFAHYAALSGTTTLVNDNLMFFMKLSNEKALSIVDECKHIPSSMYWWCRYDSQTELRNEEQIFTSERIKEWLNHPSVVQGGELTAWPKVLANNDLLLHWIQETKALKKPVEGHLPGASKKTLTAMQLLGVTSDHEAMTGHEAYMRLELGLKTVLRYSSIRPDLPKILKELKPYNMSSYEHVMFTTDGGSPAFYEKGVMNQVIDIALDQGIDPIEVYNIVSLYTASHFRMEDLHGLIAPGRVAHLNILDDIYLSNPISVMAKGKWVKVNGEDCYDEMTMDFTARDLGPLVMDFDLTKQDLYVSMPFGMEMENSVIMKPYHFSIDPSSDQLSRDHDELFLTLLDRNGKWLTSTLLKGFASQIDGLCSSYSSSGDLICLGKNKEDILKAFQRVKEIGGGIVLIEQGNVICEIPLSMSGMMSTEPVDVLIRQQKKLMQALKERGYQFDDPIYSLSFLSSTHLPYIRITPHGIYDVMKKSVLFPSVMR